MEYLRSNKIFDLHGVTLFFQVMSVSYDFVPRNLLNPITARGHIANLTLSHMRGGVFKTQVAFGALLDALGVKI